MESTNLIGIFKLIEEHNYSIDECFLCGSKLNAQNRTEEHVIPKWLQRRFNLWDQQVTLLNGTFLPYRKLTIPCCFECNNLYLKKFEDIILDAFKNGFEVFSKLDKRTIFLWLGKIFFGLIYREMFLRADREKPENGTITSPDYLRSFYAHFLFLQGIRDKHEFDNFFPSSIYLFKTQSPEGVQDQWDLIDNQQTLFIALRMGEIGLIAVLQDCEATKHLEKELDHHRDIDLHPLQFKEIVSKILYKAILMNRTPKFITTQKQGIAVTTLLPLQGLSYKPIFDDWDNDSYAEILSQLTGLPLNICQPEKGKVWTWLNDEKGNSIFIDVKKFK